MEEGPAAAVSCVSVRVRRRSKHTYIHTYLCYVTFTASLEARWRALPCMGCAYSSRRRTSSAFAVGIVCALLAAHGSVGKVGWACGERCGVRRMKVKPPRDLTQPAPRAQKWRGPIVQLAELDPPAGAGRCRCRYSCREQQEHVQRAELTRQIALLCLNLLKREPWTASDWTQCCRAHRVSCRASAQTIYQFARRLHGVPCRRGGYCGGAAAVVADGRGATATRCACAPVVRFRP